MTNLLNATNRNRVGRLAVLAIAASLAALVAFALLMGSAAADADPGLVIEGDVVSGSDINAVEGSWLSPTPSSWPPSPTPT